MRLLEQAAILDNRSASSNAERSELIGEYVHKKHLHPGAFRIVSRWLKMGQNDPQKLWLEKKHVEDMWAKAGLERFMTAQGQLLPAIADEAPPTQHAEQHAEQHVEDAPTRVTQDVFTDIPLPRQTDERAGDEALMRDLPTDIPLGREAEERTHNAPF